MNWTTYRTRGETLREVITTADRRRDGALPLDVPGVRDHFDDELDLLGALQLRWYTRLAGRIEQYLATQPLDLENAVVEAWRSTAADLRGARAVIDRHTDAPTDPATGRALATARRKEHLLLAVMAGRGSVRADGVDGAAAAIGAAIEQRARAGLPDPRPARSPRCSRLGRPHAGLLCRMRRLVRA